MFGFQRVIPSKKEKKKMKRAARNKEGKCRKNTRPVKKEWISIRIVREEKRTKLTDMFPSAKGRRRRSHTQRESPKLG